MRTHNRVWSQHVSGEVLKPISLHKATGWKIPFKKLEIPASLSPALKIFACQKSTHSEHKTMKKSYRSVAIIFSRHKERRLMTSSLLQALARDIFLLLTACLPFLNNININSVKFQRRQSGFGIVCLKSTSQILSMKIEFI